MQALPFDDASFDLALSVFGLIFAADASRAFDEMIRVLRPAGRALFSVWVPAGPIDAMVATFGRAVAAATGRRPRRFAWHDADAVGALAARHHAHVQIHEGRLCITAASPEAYLEANEQEHPVSVAGRPVLERAGTYGQVRDRGSPHPARGQRRSASVPCLQSVPRDRGPPPGLIAGRASRRAPAIRAATPIGATRHHSTGTMGAASNFAPGSASQGCGTTAIASECDGRAQWASADKSRQGRRCSQAMEKPRADGRRLLSRSSKRRSVRAWGMNATAHEHVRKRRLAMTAKIKDQAAVSSSQHLSQAVA